MPNPAQDISAAPPWRQSIPRLVLRLGVLVAIVYLSHLGINAALSWTESLPQGERDAAQFRVLVAVFVLYALLISIPFVPGLEIALALLMLRGADLALPIYLSTILGLMLAYCAGRLIPLTALSRVFIDLHLRRAAALVDRIAPLSPLDRITALQAHLPQRIAAPVMRFRYLGLALLINMPGSVLIGGGGGICLVAGISRLFAPHWFVLTLFLAVLPVPLFLWISGSAGLSTWLPG
jgi:hypothetical protein